MISFEILADITSIKAILWKSFWETFFFNLFPIKMPNKIIGNSMMASCIIKDVKIPMFI